MKKLVTILIYNLIAVLLLFIMCELFVRIFFPQIKPQLSDRHLIADGRYLNSHGLTPNSRGYSNGAPVTTNPFGFREGSVKMDTSRKSILLLGDSMTMGIGVEADSTFAGRIQLLMDSVNVLNPSVMGYDIEDYRNLTEYFIVNQNNSLEITRILICWCLNDVYTKIPDFETPGGRLRDFLGNSLKFIRTHSRFYMWLKTQFFDRPKSYYFFDEKFYSPDNDVFKNCIHEFKKIKEICTQHQIPLHVVLLPYEYQLRDEYKAKQTPQDLMDDTLSKNGLSVFNTMPFMKRNDFSSTELYLYGDGIHFSEAGHRLIAEFISEKVFEN